MENNSRPIVDGAAILGGIAASNQWLPARSGSQTKFLPAVMVPGVVMVPERYQLAGKAHAASPIALCCLPHALSEKNRAFFSSSSTRTCR
ncbi:hypothetical protein CF138_04135 [Aeromonas hydrophila]|nr:hypothetical protein CF141_16140 [Aeromonas hydrophila]TNH89827.1 hypothetical protein CF138_04135 [Aeromonas hydrophila]TNI01103.1 hypothetical protein CF136_08270 [Aeromonas hydrophila]TNI94915.1 hypothetical protein CF118_14870 [Aeromonas hydrophila]